MQPTGTVLTTLIGDHPGIIPVKFGVQVKKLTDDGQRTPHDGQRMVTIAHPVLR